MANVESLCQLLQKNGWYLKADFIQQQISDGKEVTDDIISAALNNDLTNIGEQLLAARLNGGNVGCIEGPVVLQINKLRSVSVPKENELASLAPQLLKLHLTDGHSFCNGIVNDNIEGLTLDTPPGAKIRLDGRVPLSQNCLQLSSVNCRLLGGAVDSLKFSTSKKVMNSKPAAGDSTLPKLNGVAGSDSSVDSDSDSSVRRTSNGRNIWPHHQSFSTNHSKENGLPAGPLPDAQKFNGHHHDGYRHHNLQSSRLPRSHDTNGRLSRHHGDDTSEGVTLRPPVPPTVFDYMPDTVKKEVKVKDKEKDVRVESGSRAIVGQGSQAERDTPDTETSAGNEDQDVSNQYPTRDNRLLYTNAPAGASRSSYSYRHDLPPRFRRKQQERERQGFVYSNFNGDVGEFPLPNELHSAEHVSWHQIHDHNSRGFVDPNRRLWDSDGGEQRSGRPQYQSHAPFYNDPPRPNMWPGNGALVPTPAYWLPGQPHPAHLVPANVVPAFGHFPQPMGHFVVPDQRTHNQGQLPAMYSVAEAYSALPLSPINTLPHGFVAAPQLQQSAPNEASAMTPVLSTSMPVLSNSAAYIQHVTQQMQDVSISQQQLLPYPGGVVQSQVSVDQPLSPVYVMSPPQLALQQQQQCPVTVATQSEVSVDQQQPPVVQAPSPVLASEPQVTNGTKTPVNTPVVAGNTPADVEIAQNEGAENKVVSAGWQIGDKCMARYWQDGQLYRATIVAVQVEGECCTVHFVDYGNVETVLWSDLVKVAADVWESSLPVAIPSQAPVHAVSPVYVQAPPVAFAPYDLGFPGNQLPAAGPGFAYVTRSVDTATMYNMAPAAFYIPATQPPA